MSLIFSFFFSLLQKSEAVNTSKADEDHTNADIEAFENIGRIEAQFVDLSDF